MIASLAMYQRPQLVDSHSRFWRLIASNLRDAGLNSPEQLSQNAGEDRVWQHPELVLSQTCGMPYRTWLHDKVELVGTPDYGLTNCPPGFYRSALVVRLDDPREELPEFRTSTFAYNQSFSQSGYAAPFWHLEAHSYWFENRLYTEQHLESARAVALGRADIASLDAVSWRLIQTYEPFASNLRVLEWTAPTPGLPLITAKGNDPAVIFTAVERAITQLQDKDRDLLGILGLVFIPKEDYLTLLNPTN